MNKVKLDLNSLQVESFETAAVEGLERGTVHGHYSAPGTCHARVDTCHYAGTCGSECLSVNGCTWDCG